MNDDLDGRIRRLAGELGDAAPSAPDWATVRTTTVPARRPVWLAPVTVLGLAVGVIAVATVTTRPGPGPTAPTAPTVVPTRVEPTTAASTTADTTTTLASTVATDPTSPPTSAVIDIDALTRELTEVHSSLQLSEAALIGWSITINGGNTDQLSECMAARGVEYRGSAMDFVVLGPRPRTDPEPYAADPDWYIRPDVELARAGGVGITVRNEPIGARWDMVPSDPAGTAAPDPDPGRYDEVFSACEQRLTGSMENPLAWQLDNEMFAMSRTAEERPEFAPIRDQYRACMAASGFEVEDPVEIEVMMVNGEFPSDTDVPAYEVAIAVADAECRAPLWERFIELDASAWRDWLDRNTDRIAAAEMQQSEYEAIALAAWVPGSEESVTQITSAGAA